MVILGYSEAGMYLRGPLGARVAGVISIHGAREFGVEWAGELRLDLEFDDVETVAAGDMGGWQRALSRKRWAERNGLVEVEPVRADVEAIVRFAEAARGLEGVVLCHCGGGMSRAPAAALICLATWLGEGAEERAVAEMRSVRPAAVPHEGLVRMGDEVLGRGRRLVEAVRDH